LRSADRGGGRTGIHRHHCGCWVPRIGGGGAGAVWLRDLDAMVAMARQIVETVELPVTVKTRIGWGPESPMPIVGLARRLENVGSPR
jgi:tRNA-dihydrouridine synthase B